MPKLANIKRASDPKHIAKVNSNKKSRSINKKQKIESEQQKGAEKQRLRQSRGGYKIVDYNMRVDIIYDSLVHNIQPIEISRARNVKYNTVRHVLQQYYQKGCINTIKYKAIQNKQAAEMMKQSSQDSQNTTSAESQNEDEVNEFEEQDSDPRLITKQVTKPKLDDIEEKDAEEEQTIENANDKDGQDEDAEEKQVRSYQRVFDKGTVDNFLLKGPQRIDPKDFSSACSLALFFVQDEDDVDDSVHRLPQQSTYNGRPQVFTQRTLYPYHMMTTMVEETDCFKDVVDSTGVYSFIDKFKNFNTLRK